MIARRHRCSRRGTWPAAVAFASVLAAASPARAALFGLLGDGCIPKDGSTLEALRERGENRFNPAMAIDHSRTLKLLKPRWHGLLPSKELDAYLNGLLERLARTVNSSGLPARVYATTSTDFQATVSPDGAIFLPYGMISQVESEDELAFILAHELGHVLFRHHKSDWFIKTQYYTVISGAVLDSVASGLATAKGALGQVSRARAKEIEEALWKVRLVYDVSETVVQPAWNSSQDRCADTLGYDVMRAAGYNPDVINDFFGRVVTLEAGRAAKAETALAESVGSDVGAYGVVDWWHDLWNFLRKHLREMLEVLNAQRNASERQKKLAEYATRFALVDADANNLPWKVKRSAGIADLLEHYATATGAIEELSAQSVDSKAAENIAKKILGALKLPSQGHALPLYALALARREQGRDKDYVENLEAGTHAPEPSWAVYSSLIARRMELRELGKADAMMKLAMHRFADSPVLLPRRIELAFRNDRKADIPALRVQCMKYEIKDLSERCNRAASTGDQSTTE